MSKLPPRYTPKSSPHFVLRPPGIPHPGLPSSTKHLLSLVQEWDNGSPRLHMKQLVVLFFIALNEGKTQREMCGELEVTQTNISVILKFLDDLGWIKGVGDGTICAPSKYYLTSLGLRYIHKAASMLSDGEPEELPVPDQPMRNH